MRTQRSEPAGQDSLSGNPALPAAINLLSKPQVLIPGLTFESPTPPSHIPRNLLIRIDSATGMTVREGRKCWGGPAGVGRESVLNFSTRTAGLTAKGERATHEYKVTTLGAAPSAASQLCT